MAAGVEIVEIPGQRRHPPQVVLQYLRRKSAGFGVGGAKIHGVGPVGHQFSKALGFQHGHRLFRIGSVLLLRLAAPGIPGKEGKGISPDGQGGFHHGGIAAAGGQVTSKITHHLHSFWGIIAYSRRKCKLGLAQRYGCGIMEGIYESS